MEARKARKHAKHASTQARISWILSKFETILEYLFFISDFFHNSKLFDVSGYAATF